MEIERLVVLASGMGSRLRSKASPKPLARLAGITLLERTIAAAKDAGFEEVVVVTGHRADRVGRHAMDVSRRRGIPVALVHNDRFREGNGLSALAAREITGDDPFVLVMADHVFATSLLPRLRHTDLEPREVIAVVDPALGRMARVDADDAMKVRLDGDRVTAIAKDLDRYDAFDIGAFVCSPALFDAIETAATTGDSSLAAAIRLMARNGTVRAAPIRDDEWWFDVDTPRDHRNGGQHLMRRTGKQLDGAVAARVNRVVSQRVVTPALIRVGLTPNQVTLVAFGVAVAAAFAFAAGAPAVAALLVALSSVLDGSDGEVARLTHRSSSFGGFLDAALDRAADGLLITGAAVFLATNADLAAVLGEFHLEVVIAVSGIALTGHLLVSYTTAKAAVDLGHRYRGPLVGGGHGRDLRLGLITIGALSAAVVPLALLVALGAVAALTWWIVGVRFHASWWSVGRGRAFVGVQAVALDFDGTVIDSMGFLTDLAVALLVDEVGFDPETARRRYLATTGADFRTQLDELAPGHPRLGELAQRFEERKTDGLSACRVFADARPALVRLSEAGVPILICSSTRRGLVRWACERHGLAPFVSDIAGWTPGEDKTQQLANWMRTHGLPGHHTAFVGDSRRDADVARNVGARFIGIARRDAPDLLAGSGAAVVSTLDELADAIVRAQRSPVATPVVQPVAVRAAQAPAPMGSTRRPVARHSVRLHEAPRTGDQPRREPGTPPRS